MQVKTKNMIVGALAVLFVAAIWYQFVYSPMENKASKAKTAAHDADTQATSLKQQLHGGSNSKSPTKKADIPAADLAAALPQDAAESAFFRDVDSLRITSGADWQSVSPSNGVASGTVTTINVGIVVQGTEDQLARYVSGLADMKRIFVTDNLSISAGGADATGGGAIFSGDKLSMTISGRIFSQPTAAASTTAGAGGTTPATGAPAPTGAAPGSATVNG